MKIEADYDKKIKESQTENDITVRWDMGLNQKRLAWFSMPKLESGEVRLAVGDELRMKFTGMRDATNWGGVKGLQALNKASGATNDVWETVGSVIKVPNSESDSYILLTPQTSLMRSVWNSRGMTESRLIAHMDLQSTLSGKRRVSIGCKRL